MEYFGIPESNNILRTFFLIIIIYSIIGNSECCDCSNSSSDGVVDNFNAVGYVEKGSGTLIADNIVLTAAHNFCEPESAAVCNNTTTFVLQNASPVGEPDICEDIPFVGTVHYYPAYFENPFSNCYDFAIIKLYTPVSQKVTNIAPLPMGDSTSSLTDGEILTGVGYGNVGICCDDATPTTEKNAKKLSISYNSLPGEIRSTSYSPACGGDSGGPLLKDGKIVGVISYGCTPGNMSCPCTCIICSTIKPEIRTWILDEINNAKEGSPSSNAISGPNFYAYSKYLKSIYYMLETSFVDFIFSYLKDIYNSIR